MEQEREFTIKLLTEMYKTRVQFFSHHATRAWTRFNILLTMEVALFGWFLSVYFDKGTSLSSLWLIPVLGAVVSTVWYILGAQERDA
jgi:hypothetical protein